MDKQKRAVTVARVSTRKQDTKTSPETQLQGCREYAESIGVDVIEQLRDAISGTVPIAERPAGKRLYQLVSDHAVDLVILFTNDRTARDEYSIEYLLLKDHCYSNGIELHYADTGRDENTTTGNIIGYLKAQMASDERQKILERTMRAKSKKLESAGYLGGNTVRFGFKVAGIGAESHIVIDEERAGIVRYIFGLYLGREKQAPLSLFGVKARLNSEGIPASRGGKWANFTVRDVLTSREYIGIFTFGAKEVKHDHLAIIDEATFLAVQNRLQRNKQLAQRNRKREYLLTGYLQCSCGGTLRGQTSTTGGKEYHYYACARRLEDKRSCTERYIRADEVDTRTWQELEKILDDHTLQQGLSRMAQRKELEIKPKRDRLAQVEKKLQACNEKIERMMSEWGDEGDERLRADAKLAIKRENKQREGLEKERNTLLDEIAQKELSQEAQRKIKITVADVRQKFDDATFAKKRYVLDKLDVRLILRHDDKGRWFDGTCGIGDFAVKFDRS